MKISFGKVAQAIGLTILVCSAAWSAPKYTVTELCLPSGTQYSSAAGACGYGINNLGQVVGEMVTNSSNTTAIRWDSNGQATAISPTISISSGYNTCYSINDSGIAVGQSGAYKPACWQDGATSADYLALTGQAWDINNSGQVVGYDGSHVVIWQGGQAISTGIVQSSSGTFNTGQHMEAEISENGKVAATTYVNGHYRASYWDGTSAVDIGTLDSYPYYPNTPDRFCYAYGVNDSGQVVGCTTVSSYMQAPTDHAFVWKSGAMTDLGTLGSDAYSSAYHINNKGQVVGWSSSRQDGQLSKAFLYENGQIIDLNSCITDPDWHLETATCINENGQIVGMGKKEINGVVCDCAVLLTPEAPEPSSLLALFGGLAGIGGMIRLRKRS